MLTIAIAANKNAAACAEPFVFAFAIHVFAHEGGYVSWLLKRGPFLLVGTLSYSIYMLHMFVEIRFVNLARLIDRWFDTALVADITSDGKYGIGIDPGNAFLGDLIFVAVVATTVVLSYATYRLVEQPGRMYFKKLADRLFG